MFLLDTDHVTILQRQTQPEFDRLRARMAGHAPAEFFVSIISFHEQALGWNAYISRATDAAGVVRGYRMFQQILADFAAAQVLAFDSTAAATFDLLRTNRIRVPTMDLRIASIALSQGPASADAKRCGLLAGAGAPGGGLDAVTRSSPLPRPGRWKQRCALSTPAPRLS